ncbi:hypothetical protein NDU88_000862 [Pleurodeles waltl]|uniref:Uncharacterized protein n=1 Tax=Pleurodeles waltl TaxID=8319 RepID=A0AAV7TH35_PLEWA|nr:hypothetical protein NDU88_000862 [Pleurodeles waltl]
MRPLPLPLLKDGHNDPKQKQLILDTSKTPHHQSSPPGHKAILETSAPDPPLNGAAAIVDKICSSFKAIDSGFDALSLHLDSMSEWLDKHGSRIDEVECRVSEAGDGNVDMLKCLERVEHILNATTAKNEDLEARSHRNNVCITGMAETTHAGSMITIMENLLTNLFGSSSFTGTFMVERVHPTLGLHPALGA